eukprot:s515_g8.t1
MGCIGCKVRQVEAAVKEPLPASLQKAPRGRFAGALPRPEEGRRDFARIFFADQRKIFFLGPNMTSMMPLQPTGGPSSAHIGDLNEQVVDKAESLFKESLLKQLEQAIGPPKNELLEVLVHRAMAAMTVNVGIDFATTMQLMPTFLQPLFLIVVRGDDTIKEELMDAQPENIFGVRVLGQDSIKQPVKMGEAPVENAPGSRKVLADEVAAPFREEIRQAVATMGGVGPKLVGFLANTDPAAKKYAEWTGKAMTADNLRFELREVQESNLEDGRKGPWGMEGTMGLEELEKANKEPDVDGIMIYYPVFGQRPSFHGGSHDDYLRDTVSPYKDAEGLNHFYRRALYQNKRCVDAENTKKCVLPCTPLAVVKTLEHLKVYDPALPIGERMTGKTAVVVNRSEVVGRPAIDWYFEEGMKEENDGAKVWSVDIDSVYIFMRGKLVLPSESTSVETAVKEADIVILGEKYKMDPSWIKEGAVVINVATSKNIDEKALLTTRPGVRYVGQVGKVTVAMLERNLLRLHENFKDKVKEGRGGDFYLA